MSQWTHVAATIQFDGMLVDGQEFKRPDLGNSCTFHSSAEEWDKCDVPRGSEGSLQYTLWNNPDPSSATRWVATIWGDLRDYGAKGVPRILQYLKRICKDQWVRQGVAQIHVDRVGTMIYSFHPEREKWEHVVTQDEV